MHDDAWVAKMLCCRESWYDIAGFSRHADLVPNGNSVNGTSCVTLVCFCIVCCACGPTQWLSLRQFGADAEGVDHGIGTDVISLADSQSVTDLILTLAESLLPRGLSSIPEQGHGCPCQSLDAELIVALLFLNGARSSDGHL